MCVTLLSLHFNCIIACSRIGSRLVFYTLIVATVWIFELTGCCLVKRIEEKKLFTTRRVILNPCRSQISGKHLSFRSGDLNFGRFSPFQEITPVISDCFDSQTMVFPGCLACFPSYLPRVRDIAPYCSVFGRW